MSDRATRSGEPRHLGLNVPSGRTLRILCLGAHADDIEIGCGGTVLRLLEERRRVHCTWVVFSGAGGRREDEARKSASLFLAGARDREVQVHGFRDGYFPYDDGIKDAFEELKKQPPPDLVFTHARRDRHQDHRVVSDLTWNTFRRHLVLEYEVPKYDGDLGHPNLYVPLSRTVCRAKVRHLLAAFPAERRRRPWFTPDTFLGLLRLRGIESGAREGHAEAFHARKVLFAV